MEAYIDKVKPDMIYTHYGQGLNIDHRRTSEAVLTATRPVGNYSVKEIYEFEKNLICNLLIRHENRYPLIDNVKFFIDV